MHPGRGNALSDEVLHACLMRLLEKSTYAGETHGLQRQYKEEMRMRVHFEAAMVRRDKERDMERNALLRTSRVWVMSIAGFIFRRWADFTEVRCQTTFRKFLQLDTASSSLLLMATLRT